MQTAIKASGWPLELSLLTYPRKKIPIVIAQPEITARMPTTQDQMPGAESWEGEGMGMSQLRPPAVVCGENVQVFLQPALAQASVFNELMIGRKTNTTLKHLRK